MIFPLSSFFFNLPGKRINFFDPKQRATIRFSSGNLERFGNKTGWQSKPGPAGIEWIEIAPLKPILLNGLVITTLPKRTQNGNRHGVRDFDLHVHDTRDRVQTASIRKNEERTIPVSFKPCRVTQIKITFLGANLPAGDQVYNALQRPFYTLFSVEGFLKKHIRKVEKKFSKSVKNGPLGAVCIFCGNELEGPVPGIDPGELAEEFRKKGFGVNWITAEELAAVPGKRIPFDLFVNLAGKNFPAESWIYRGLQEGCHLLSLGSLPFSEPWVAEDGRWRRLGKDLGITATAPDWVQDHASRAPEQLRVDTTRHRVIRAAEKVTSVLPGNPLELAGKFSGHAVTADLGEILSIEQDLELVKNGLWRSENVQARIRTSQKPLMYGVWGHDYNPIFQTPCARFVPLLETEQGPVGAAIINYAGYYAGSNWGFIEMDDFSLLSEEKKNEFYGWLSGLARRLAKGPWFAFLRPGRYGLRRNETCNLRLGLSDGKNVAVKKEKFRLPANTPTGLYHIRRDLDFKGEKVDTLETAVLVRDVSSKPLGTVVEYRENIFSLDGKAQLLLGARTDGFHLWGQPEQDPLAWDRTLRIMRAMNLRVFSPVHLSYYEHQGALPEFLWDIIETQAELCQRHGIIFAPCLFFPGALECIRNEKDSIKLAREFSRRMQKFNGFFLYLYDDGLPQDVERFNAWVGLLRPAIQKERPGTLITAEFVNHPVYHALIKAAGKQLDFLAISHHAMVPDPLPNLLVDSTLNYKATTNAEFGVSNPDDSVSATFKYRLNLRLGIAQGHSLILNWMIQDPAHAQFPWGCLYARDAFPKSTGRVFQLETMMISDLTSLPPGKKSVAVLIPSRRMRFNQSQAAEIYGGDITLEEKLRMLLRAGIDFQVVNEDELPLLGSATKFLIIPRLTDPDRELKRILKKLPYTLLWQKDGFRPRPQFARELKRLILLEPGSPWDFAAQVYRVLFKKKWAGMVNTRFLFSRKFKECTYYLLSDLPKSELTPSSGEIELENNHFKYQLDEDRLGILLLKKGEISGLTGFQRLKMNGTPIVDGPGFFYARQNAPGKWNVAALVPGRFNFMNRQVSFIQKDVGQAREICLADGNHAK